MLWDPPALARDQIVLFPERLDQALPANHSVRRFVEVLDQLDWSDWEAEFKDESRGRPPIHPRVMSGIILYGLMRRIRSSRLLEEALQIRLDFRWLAEARSIDHSTICRFRHAYAQHLKDLFVKVTLVAQAAGLLSIVELAVDGTKVRSSNHRSAKYKVGDLAKTKKQLELQFEELLKEAAELDELDTKKRNKLDKQLENNRHRAKQINRAIAEVEKLEAAGKSIPNQIPITDVESRVTKTKEGGFAPNYTPVNAVDPNSGMIAATEVIADCNEKSVLPQALDDTKESLGEQTQRVSADTIFNHGSNLKEMKKRDVTLYTPIKETPDNPAVRDDPTQPVPPEQWGKLPTEQERLSKEAFVFDEEANCYYCPQGQPLEYSSTSSAEPADGSTKYNSRYRSNQEFCSGCPLKERCIAPKSKCRQVSRDDAEPLRDELRERMRSGEAQEVYNRRMISELPFAVIKHWMGLRQFLHRGLEKVRQEWQWATIAYNINRIISMLQPRAGPDQKLDFNLPPPNP